LYGVVKLSEIMKRLVILTTLLISATLAQAQIRDTLLSEPPRRYPEWMLWVPGATHFADGRFADGLILSTIEVGGIASGIIYNAKLKESSASPYYNFPLFIGLKAWEVDKCDLFRNQLQFLQYKVPTFKYDPLPFREMVKAPLRPRNIFTPITGILVAVACAELWYYSKNSDYSINEVEQMAFLDRYIDRNPALAIYGTSSLALSMGAGISEEYVFRNFLMPILDYRYGQNKGLIISSAAFGAAHAFNYLFVENPDPLTVLYHVGFTTFFGYILGKNIQNQNYHISQAIAAHTWYDFILMLGSFLLIPQDNIFGVNIKVRI